METDHVILVLFKREGLLTIGREDVYKFNGIASSLD